MNSGIPLKLPALLLRRDPLVGDLPRFGVCDCCGRRSVFLRLVHKEAAERFASWPYPADYLRRCATRENWFCAWCRRSYRMRMLARVAWPYTSGNVYQAGAFTIFVGKRSPASLIVSEYVAKDEQNSPAGDLVRQDLQRLTFPAESFDLVLTSEILEHVAVPWKAFDEIRRVLRPAGRHVFTVPEMPGQETRNRTGLPDVFHMDGPGRGSLVVTDYGDDLPTLLRDHGFATTVHAFESVSVYESVAV